jgi:hypothetical protein
MLRGSTLKRVLPLFLFILVAAAPMPALAANTTTFGGIGMPQQTNLCLDDNSLRVNSTMTIDDGTGPITYTTSSDKLCTNGCSYTLQDCRPGVFYETAGFLIWAAFLAGIIIFAASMEVSGIFLALGAFVVSVWVATWDVFSGLLVYFVRMLPFVLAIFVVYHGVQLRNRERAEKEQEAEGG